MPYLGLLVTALLVTAIVDIARADEARIRGFGRTQWTLLVVLAPVAGALAWFIAGRPSPDRVVPAAPSIDDAAEEEFRRRCRERVEMQRRAARSRRDSAPD
ncbi:PLDc N-terminal domain-containing protein [Mycolicibacterium cosmeticum]|uniref:PLDc N-terminal domain-containing protein n=1 Tax=Mycolicibacterium cosmeticum TaxID=258533 RepID=UPI0032049015